MKPSTMTERIQCVLCGRWFLPTTFFHHWHQEDWGNDA